MCESITHSNRIIQLNTATHTLIRVVRFHLIGRHLRPVIACSVYAVQFVGLFHCNATNEVYKRAVHEQWMVRFASKLGFHTKLNWIEFTSFESRMFPRWCWDNSVAANNIGNFQIKACSICCLHSNSYNLDLLHRVGSVAQGRVNSLESTRISSATVKD